MTNNEITQAAVNEVAQRIYEKASKLKKPTIRELLLATFKGMANAESKGYLNYHAVFIGMSQSKYCIACAATSCLIETLQLDKEDVTVLASNYLEVPRAVRRAIPPDYWKGEGAVILRKIEADINAFRIFTPETMLLHFGSNDMDVYRQEVNCIFHLYRQFDFKVAMETLASTPTVASSLKMRLASERLLYVVIRNLPSHIYR